MSNRPPPPPRRRSWRRPFAPLCALAVSVACLARTASSAPPRAAAGPHDAAAQKLREGAMYKDYVQLSLPEALKKLESAQALCQAAEDCSHAVRAQIFVDIGVVEFGLQRPDEARAQFAKAVGEDPNIVIGPDFSTAELEKELAAIKAQAAPAPSATAAAPPVVAPTPEPTEAPPVKTGPAPETSTSDCPPDFPGCTAHGVSCTSNDDCSAPQTCNDGTCSAEQGETALLPYKKNWISVAFQLDFLLLQSAMNTCSGGSGYTCFNGTTYYSAIPLKGADDVVNSGVKPATMAALAGYDRAVSRNFMIGVRLGYAFNGGPQRPTGSSFLPLHAEARVSYWFGKNALGKPGVRFYVVAAGGIKEVDGEVAVDVYKNAAAYPKNQTDLDAWTKTGTGFVGGGGGMMVAIKPFTGIFIEAKANEEFPTTGTTFDVNLGYVIGF